ncbi:MAG: transposase [Nitrospirota bacterium]
MKRSKFSEEQIVYAIRQADAGTPIGDLCRQLGVRAATCYAGKKRSAAPGRECATPTPAAGGRTQPINTARGRPLARQAHAGGGPAKHSLRPVHRRELAKVSGHVPGAVCAGSLRYRWDRRSAGAWIVSMIPWLTGGRFGS